MLELLYSAHIACAGLFCNKASLLPNCTWGCVPCVLVMMSFEVAVPVKGSLDVQ